MVTGPMLRPCRSEVAVEVTPEAPWVTAAVEALSAVLPDCSLRNPALADALEEATELAACSW
jgi:hypothetical protein